MATLRHSNPRRPVPWRLLFGAGLLLVVAGAWWSLSGYSAVQTGNAALVTPAEAPWKLEKPPYPVEPPPPSAPARNELAELQTLLKAEFGRVHQTNDAQNQRLTALEQRREETKEPQAKGAPPKPRPHRPMGHMIFAQPEGKQEAEPLYTLTPGDTILPCTVLTKVHSDIQSIATVKISTNVYDTESRRKILIPQGSTILVKYHSAGLIYGNERLPLSSTLLTLPNGRTIDLDNEPLMDGVGQAGLVSDINRHYMRALGAVLIQGVLKGTQQVVTTANPLASGITGSATQYGQTATQPYLSLRPTLTVNAGESCNAILTRTIQLPEYRERW